MSGVWEDKTEVRERKGKAKGKATGVKGEKSKARENMKARESLKELKDFFIGSEGEEKAESTSNLENI